MVWERVKLIYFGVFLSQTMWNHTKDQWRALLLAVKVESNFNKQARKLGRCDSNLQSETINDWPTDPLIHWRGSNQTFFHLASRQNFANALAEICIPLLRVHHICYKNLPLPRILWPVSLWGTGHAVLTCQLLTAASYKLNKSILWIG